MPQPIPASFQRFQFSGTVSTGAGRGRGLGFPTANISIKKEIPEGIYAGRVQVAASPAWIDAAVFIGRAETFDDDTVRAEVHILDFSGDLYGQALMVNVLHYIRACQKFESSQALVQAIEHDITQIRSLLQDLPLESAN